MAARCRELAETATDPEVAEALRDMATDIEVAIPVIESEGLRASGCAPQDFQSNAFFQLGHGANYMVAIGAADE